jgi:transcriptional regulator with XRE-family HTH domain
MPQPKETEAPSLYPNNIGRCIKKQGYTQEEVADAIGIARRTLTNYISGKRATPRYCLEKIAKAIGCEIEALTFQPENDSSPSSQDASEIRQETVSDHITEGDDDMDRRRTLQFLGAAGTLIVGVPAITHLEEVEQLIRRRVARLQTWLVDSLEDATLQRWQLYYTSRNSLTEGGLFRQIGRLEQLADDGGGDESRIYSILIQNYQLAGSLARDNFYYTKAKKYFRDAQRLAHEIQSPDLTATAVARHAVVLMRQAGGDVTDSGYSKLVADALELYRSAAEIAARAEAYVRAYVLAGLAEALARNGHRDECYRSLDQAEQLFHRSLVISPEEDIAQVRLTLQSLEDTRGECYVLLGEPLKGLNYLQTAQKSLNPTISRNLCRLLMQQSEAYLAAGYPDQCVHNALQGLQIARTLESTSNINWSHEIHIKLLRSKWRDETVIGELEAALAG